MRWKGQQTHSLNYTHIHILLHTDFQESKKQITIAQVWITKCSYIESSCFKGTGITCHIRAPFWGSEGQLWKAFVTEPIHQSYWTNENRKTISSGNALETARVKGRNKCSKSEVCKDVETEDDKKSFLKNIWAMSLDCYMKHKGRVLWEQKHQRSICSTLGPAPRDIPDIIYMPRSSCNAPNRGCLPAKNDLMTNVISAKHILLKTTVLKSYYRSNIFTRNSISCDFPKPCFMITSQCFSSGSKTACWLPT